MADDVFALGLDGGVLLQRGSLGRRQDAIEAAQNGEGQNDLAILVPLVGAAKQIADAPDETGDLGMGFSGHEMGWCCACWRRSRGRGEKYRRARGKSRHRCRARRGLSRRRGEGLWASSENDA